MAATITRRQPQIVNSTLNAAKPLFRGGPEEPWVKETAGQTYKVADLVYLDANGTIAICTNAAGVENSAILGLAVQPATGVTGTNAYVEVIRPDSIVEMNIYHGTPASAALTQAMLGQVCQVKLVSGVWVVDIETAIATIEGAAAALAKAQIVGFVNAVGDFYARVLVKFLPFTIQTNGAGLVRNLQGA
jgi:hypothetical protein